MLWGEDDDGRSDPWQVSSAVESELSETAQLSDPAHAQVISEGTFHEYGQSRVSCLSLWSPESMLLLFFGSAWWEWKLRCAG